jgi:hemerythrin superfamily protein
MGTMGKTMTTGGDVVSFLKDQHEQVKSLFQEVRYTAGKERSAAFRALRRMLAVHETAEEEIVHPAARISLPGGDAIVTARLEEERKAKDALVELEKLDVDSQEFESKLSALEGDVLAHAAAEEMTEFDRLADQLDPTRLERMQRAVAFAEAVAPTRPHPGIESQGANLLVGPFVSMVDRARDAIQSRK